MTSPSKKDIHLAACAMSKAEAAERRERRQRNHAMRLRHAARDRLARVQRHEARNETLRHDAAVARILAKADKDIGVASLATAFASVANPTDWRFSIEAVIPHALDDAQYDLIVASIRFFACAKDVGTIRDADRVEFHADGLMDNTHGDCAVARGESVDRAVAAAVEHGLAAQELALAA